MVRGVNFKMSHWGTVLIVFVGICSALCIAKQNFQVSIERADVFDVDPELLKLSVRVTKYNRTCKALSANFTYLKDMDYDVTAEVQVFALYSNEYRPTPVLFTRNLCDLFEMEFLWIKNQIEKYSDFTTKCPMRAGDYYLKDFVVDGADFPAVANFPWTSVMFRIRLFYTGALYLNFHLYVTFDHDAELKKLG